MPTTTTGLATSYIQFSRASNATVTDADGKIKWAGHNLLTNSESFDAASWSRSGISAVTANSTVAPNGTTTADTVVEDTSASASHFVAQTPTIPAAQAITYGVWVKRGSGTRNIAITIIASGGSDYISQVYDLGAGTLGSSTAVGTGVITDKTISSVGSGWYYITLTGTPSTTAAVTGGACRLALANGTTFGSQTYTGDGTSSVILWGAHLYRSDLGGMVLNPARGDAYYPTTPPNLLGFTEDFSNAAWNRSGTNVTSNTLLAPNGLQTADLISNTTSASAHGVYQTISFSAACTMSIYAKAGTSNFVGLTNTSSTTPAAYSGAVFNLAAGTVTLSNNCTATITSVGNGWYRCAIAALTVAGSYFVVSVAENGTNAPWNGYTGGDQSIYLWGAQLSDSASLDAYSPVYGAAVTSAAYYAPRLDFDPVTLAARGLLVEEQRTNLVLRSQEFDNASWTKTRATVTANAIAAPDGTVSAEKVIADNTSTTTHLVAQNVGSITQGARYTASVYLAAAEYTTAAFRVLNAGGGSATYQVTLTGAGSGTLTDNISGGGTVASITSVGGIWYRVSISWTAFTGANAGYCDVLIYPNTSGNYTGNNTDGVYAYGAQLELGSFPTSLIPTGASTATRTADVASVSTQAFPYSATEGTWVASFQVIGVTSNNRIIGANVLDDVTPIFTPSTTKIATWNGSVLLETAVGSSSTSAVKGAMAHNASGRSIVYNGGTVASDAQTMQSFTSALLGRGNFGNGMNGWLRQITYIPRRLSNAELQSRSV